MSALRRVEGLPIIAVFLLLVGLFMLAAPQVFLGHRIYLSFLNTVPPVLLLALGLTLVIAAGEIDLSFPSVIAFSGYLLALCVKDLELPWLGVPLALLGGALVGWTNGVLVAVVGVPSIIATLATQFFWGGLTTGISGGVSYSLRTVDQHWVHTLFAGEILGFPVQFVWALAVALLLWFVLNRHRFGEHLLFIGDNANVARVVGIQVESEKIRLFTLMGVLGALAGIILTLENKNFFNTQGQGYLLVALAAVFIGGTSIFGGQATIVGSFFGAFIITMIEAGLVASGVQGFWVRAVVGLVFLGAVIFHLAMEQPQRLTELGRRLGLAREAPVRERQPEPSRSGRPISGS
ncbi:MAG TPA: ABC transporter permease [Geminicoccaceae bacterium]|nr:ABC transporter permease [Geminicoccaceae bacterium]